MFFFRRTAFFMRGQPAIPVFSGSGLQATFLSSHEERRQDWGHRPLDPQWFARLSLEGKPGGGTAA